jgi:hypothetical protein
MVVHKPGKYTKINSISRGLTLLSYSDSVVVMDSTGTEELASAYFIRKVDGKFSYYYCTMVVNSDQSDSSI